MSRLMRDATAARRDPPAGRAIRPANLWGVVGLLGALTALLGILAFRAYLALHGLRVIDLWNNARPPVGWPKPGAAEMAGLGRVIAYAGLGLGLLALLWCAVVGAGALRRRDRRSVVFAACGALVAVVGIALAVQLGFTIAGA